MVVVAAIIFQLAVRRRKGNWEAVSQKQCQHAVMVVVAT